MFPNGSLQTWQDHYELNCNISAIFGIGYMKGSNDTASGCSEWENNDMKEEEWSQFTHRLQQ